MKSIFKGIFQVFPLSANHLELLTCYSVSGFEITDGISRSFKLNRDHRFTYLTFYENEICSLTVSLLWVFRISKLISNLLSICIFISVWILSFDYWAITTSNARVWEKGLMHGKTTWDFVWETTVLVGRFLMAWVNSTCSLFALSCL